jgi:glycosyltransferase involved in cell wall biosynthesis
MMEKITVVVPTRERCDVLAHSLRTVTAQDYDNLDIIVSDNASTDATKDVVLALDDRRVRYVNPGRRLSMSAHWEFALSQVTEGLVTILGDDDGLIPGAARRVADLANASRAAAIRSDVCYYEWPSLNNSEYGYLEIPLRAGTEIRDSKTWLNRVLNGRASYPELPMLYNGGFVHMSVLESIRRRTGAYYRSCIPDIYSAVAVAATVDRYLYVREPLAINGHSRHSTGTSQFSVRSSRKESPYAQFQSEGNIPFHPDLPLTAAGGYPNSFVAFVYESWLQYQANGTPTGRGLHARQLETILATAGKHEESLGQWGRTFAEMHQLDFDRIQTLARRRRAVLKASGLPQRFRRAVARSVLGSAGAPVRDVYDAATAAGAILSTDRSRLATLTKTVLRRSSRHGLAAVPDKTSGSSS